MCQGNLHIIKKGNIQFSYAECLPIESGHLISYEIKCHFFITNIKIDKRNKMSEVYFRIFITNVLLPIYSPPYLLKIKR